MSSVLYAYQKRKKNQLSLHTGDETRPFGESFPNTLAHRMAERCKFDSVLRYTSRSKRRTRISDLSENPNLPSNEVNKVARHSTNGSSNLLYQEPSKVSAEQRMAAFHYEVRYVVVAFHSVCECILC